jgi:hypothetical protein
VGEGDELEVVMQVREGSLQVKVTRTTGESDEAVEIT